MSAHDRQLRFRMTIDPVVMMLCAALALMLAGCEQDMADQERYDPLEASPFFADGTSARPLPQGTVARGHLRTDSHLYEGRVNDELATEFPFPITRERLLRGQQRYEIFCAVCHGSTGDGNGMIVQRGFTRPPAFYPVPEHATTAPPLHQRELALLKAPVGHYFDVITNGWGAMFSYNDRIRPEDRWAIIMYIRALQLSQHASISDLTPQQRALLEQQSTATAPAPAGPATQEANP